MAKARMSISSRVAQNLRRAVSSVTSDESKASATDGVAEVTATEGGVWVSIPGSESPTPVNGNIACEVAKGDTVSYRIENGRLSIIGNPSTPSVGSARAASFVEPVAGEVEELRKLVSANATKTASVMQQSKVIGNIANAARAVAEATNQHFFSDDNGVHVTEKEQSDWEEAHEGPNMLLNSLGQLFRDGLTNLISITTQAGARAITFWDGLGNGAGNVTASFGADGATIGKTDESHVALDYHSMRLIDKAGTAYFHISDLRDETGVATITERFFGNGSKTVFTVSLTVSAEVSATVSNDPTNTATRNGSAYVFASAPSVASVVTIVYKTTSERAKAYTLGRRMSSSNVGPYSMAEGINTESTALCSHAEGFMTEASGNYAHAEGNTTEASSTSSHAEGDHTEASGMYSHAEGNMTKASEDNAHAEGYHTQASGNGSHAEGFYSNATVSYAHAEGSSTNATGYSSHAEGRSSTSSGDYSHAEGNGTASGHYSHVEGGGSTASGHCSHAEGGRYNVDPNTGMVSTLGNIASGIGSHAEGVLTQASGEASHAGGYYTEAASDYQTAIGKYNANDPDNAFEIGNGTADDARSNAFAVTWDGAIQATLQESTVTADTSLITPRSGSNHVWHNGATCTMALGFNLVANLASGGYITIGTVPEGWRPPYTVYCSVYGNSTAVGGLQAYLQAAGGIVIRNNGSSAIGTTHNVYVTATFAM